MQVKGLVKWTIALAIGASLGFAYWYFWGCEGSCEISSSPINSSLYGMGMAAMLKWSGK